MFDNGLFLIQIAVIVGFSHLVAEIFSRFGQPRVVGEMAAGIALGPTLFGAVAPGAFHGLFPAGSLGFLNALSQAGLVIFIYLIGVRVDSGELRRQRGIALVTSGISVSVPLMMGIALAPYLYAKYGNGSHLAFNLFIGASMSVTALPVLARILLERNLLHTYIGSVAVACAAVDDIVAWTLLAAIVAITKHNPNAHPFWLIALLSAAYVSLMLLIGRALEAWLKPARSRRLPVDSILVFAVLALLSGAIGEWIGIHALVGAFIAGLITPRHFRQELIDKLETVTLLLLMPLFFALTGIRTNLIFKIGGSAYLDLVLILAVAIVSKWGGTAVGARLRGTSWRDGCQLGLLMNTRGLVELIVLNVGLDTGILSPPLFSMLVCMALVTTFMATPLMRWIGGEKWVPVRTASQAA